MVAARIQSATNLQRGSEKNRMRELDKSQTARRPRARVAYASWLCAEEGSKHGYALDLSSTGARFGGMGLHFRVGDLVLAKIIIDAAEAPLVLRAEVVRYAPCGSACPELCVKFLPGPGQAVVDEQFRLAAALTR
ncbi:MAG TPA: PilZ domain-containing protein [Myxococcota bacterium]|jgi:hypothetical protein